MAGIANLASPWRMALRKFATVGGEFYDLLVVLYVGLRSRPGRAISHNKDGPRGRRSTRARFEVIAAFVSQTAITTISRFRVMSL